MGDLLDKRFIDPEMATDAEVATVSTSDRNRANHTGTQLASTISDFTTAVQSVTIDASKIDGLAVSNLEFATLDGITTGISIQSQINGKQALGNYITALTGDVTASGPGSSIATLSNSGVTAGTYDTVTVDTKGRVTSGLTTNYQSSLSAPVTSSTAAFAATNLSVTLPIGLYKFSFIGIFQTAVTTTGAGFRIGAGTATLSTVFGKFLIPQAANGTASNFQVDQVAANTNVTSASVATANSNVLVIGNGVVRVTTAGTVRLEFRTEVAGSNAILQADSIIQFELI
jgi:hypothetical protein